MRIIISAAMSVDGHIDHGGPERLVLSHPDDLKAVYDLRDQCDAILVGAGCIRRDNPSLIPKTPERRKNRHANGLAEEPVKVTITNSGNLDPASAFFQKGTSRKLVYATKPLDLPAEVIVLPEPGIHGMIHDLASKGIRTLLVEGGTTILTEFLAAGLADELRLAVAPFFVGESSSPRFVQAAGFPHSSERRMILKDVGRQGDMAVLHYLLERA